MDTVLYFTWTLSSAALTDSNSWSVYCSSLLLFLISYSAANSLLYKSAASASSCLHLESSSMLAAVLAFWIYDLWLTLLTKYYRTADNMPATSGSQLLIQLITLSKTLVYNPTSEMFRCSSRITYLYLGTAVPEQDSDASLSSFSGSYSFILASLCWVLAKIVFKQSRELTVSPSTFPGFSGLYFPSLSSTSCDTSVHSCN